MTARQDPFSLLNALPEPQPDPVLMNAVIAQSAAEFSRRRTEANRPRNRPFFPRSGLLAWLVPTCCAAFGVVAGIALAPMMGPTVQIDRSGDMVVAEAPPSPADLPPTLSRGAPAPDAETQSPGTGEVVRMGAQSGPRLGPPPAQSAMVTTFAGEDVRVGARFTATTLALFLPDLSGDAIIDQQGMLPGEEIEILAAFRQTDPDRVAIRLRVNAQSFWRVYEPENGAYTRNAALSARVATAETSADVRELLTQD
jgi:hypothetical protein